MTDQKIPASAPLAMLEPDVEIASRGGGELWPLTAEQMKAYVAPREVAAVAAEGERCSTAMRDGTT